MVFFVFLRVGKSPFCLHKLNLIQGLFGIKVVQTLEAIRDISSGLATDCHVVVVFFFYGDSMFFFQAECELLWQQPSKGY